MLEAEQQFRRVIRHADIAKLAIAVERGVTLPQPNPTPTEETATASLRSHITRTVTEVPHRPGHPHPIPNSDGRAAGVQRRRVCGQHVQRLSQTLRPERDVSFLHAFRKADHQFTAENEPAAIGDWRDTMSNAQSALYAWVQDAVSWQITQASSAKLAAGATRVERDLITAKTDALKASSSTGPGATPSARATRAAREGCHI